MRTKLTPVFYREVEMNKQKLMEYADANNRTLAQVIRDAVEEYLKTIKFEKTAS